MNAILLPSNRFPLRSGTSHSPSQTPVGGEGVVKPRETLKVADRSFCGFKKIGISGGKSVLQSMARLEANHARLTLKRKIQIRISYCLAGILAIAAVIQFVMFTASKL